MLYHVIRRSPHYNNKNNDINFSTNSTSSSRNGTIPKLMSRYHYSRVNTPQNATASTESFFPRQKSNLTNATMTTTSNSNNNNNNSNFYSSFKSTFIPLVTNTRTLTPNKREFIQIPITREDGTTLTTNASRSVPITFISETVPLPTTTLNNTNGSTTYSKQPYSNLLRPGSRYSRYHQHHHSHGSGDESSTISTSRFPPVARRLSLTAPILTSSSTALKTDDESTKSPVSSPSSPVIRQIPIQFSQPTNAASIPTNSSRISSAVLRSSSLSHAPNSQLKRQKTDLGDISSSDFTSTLLNTSPIRRAEVMAREAIQGVVRFQQQQRNDAITDNTTTNHLTSIRSPGASRRVLVNLKNNQSVSLDSRLSSANNSFSRQSPSASRLTQRNNFFSIPISHEIQIPSHPITSPAETSFTLSQSPSISKRKTTNGSSFQTEFRTEIPIQVITSTEQENSIQENEEKQDGMVDYDQPITIITERIPSANGNSNQALKSILKRSSSRDNVPRKSVTFMHA